MSEQVSKAIGYLVLFLLVLGIVLWVVPWAFFSSIHQVFGVEVEHGFTNYVLFWVLKVIVFSPVRIERK
jgi:hypothetical protein